MSTYYGKLTPSQGKNIRTAAGTHKTGIGAELSDGENLIKIMLKNGKVSISIQSRNGAESYTYPNLLLSTHYMFPELIKTLGRHP